MPRFQIEANGKKFEVEAPDMQAAITATKGVVSPDQRMAGAFDASQPVRQVDKLSTPYNGLAISRDRLGDIHPGSVPQGLMRGFMDMPKDIAGAVQTVGDVAAGRTNAMVPDTGQGVTNPIVEDAAKTLAPLGMPLTPGLRAGEGWAAAMKPLRREKPVVPLREELKAAGSAGYNQARNMGVDYDPAAIAQFASVARAHLDQRGFSFFNAPNTYRALKKLEQPTPRSSFVQLDDLESARQMLQKADTDADKTAGAVIVQALDKFTQNPPPASVMAGPAAAAGATLKDARANWAALERSKEVSGKESKAQRRAWASNSGANLDNNLRNRVADLRDQIDKGTAYGYSKKGIAALDEFIQGGSQRNFLRTWSNRLGGGGGLGSMLTAMGSLGTAGYLAGGQSTLGAAAGVGVPMLGWGMKVAENRMAKSGIRELDEQMRKRSPLYEQRQAAAPAAPMSPEYRAALMRLAALQGLGPPPPNGGGGY